MFSHEPPNYLCSFCVLIADGRTDLDGPEDIVARTGMTMTLMASYWRPANPGSVLVVPTAHFENIYDLPARYGHAVQDAVQRVARAMRSTYQCAGVTVRQNNEPSGDQEVWHYHVHVLPRRQPRELSRAVTQIRPSAEQRRRYVELLRAGLSC